MRIHLEPYNAQWPQEFISYKSSIAEALGYKAIAIEHIGSTSIPGLSAKPVIDILVGLEDERALDDTIELMIKGGFTYMEVYKHLMSNRRYFVKYIHPLGHTPPAVLANDRVTPLADGFTNVAHIHCWILGSPDWIRHLAFRDYLLSHEDVRRSYEALKEDLALRDWESSLAYSQAKNDFIKSIEKSAIDWYSSLNKCKI